VVRDVVSYRSDALLGNGSGGIGLFPIELEVSGERQEMSEPKASDRQFGLVMVSQYRCERKRKAGGLVNLFGSV
jgi:hypothetical protein